MNIADLLSKEAVLPDLTASTRDEALAELVAPLMSLHPELQAFDMAGALREREELGSTALGEGIAIPHCKAPNLKTVALAVGRSRRGVPFGPEGQPCHIFFLIIAPEDEPGQHLRVLSQIARRARDAVFRSKLLRAENREELWQAVVAP